MPSYNVNPDGSVTDDAGNPAPQRVQESWAAFQGEKAPASSAGFYRQQANDEARAKGEPLPWPEGGKQGDEDDDGGGGQGGWRDTRLGRMFGGGRQQGGAGGPQQGGGGWGASSGGGGWR